MNTPRLHLNLRQSAANTDLEGDLCIRTSHCVCGVCATNTGGSSQDLTRTSHALRQIPHTESEVQTTAETSDRLPTESARTSDTLRRKHFEQRLDRLMVRLLLDLSTISQVKAAPTEMQAADANAVRLPVGPSGKALTEDPVRQLAGDYKRASQIKDADRRIGTKFYVITQAQGEIRSCRHSRRHAPDLGTQDGRLVVARFAREHGTRRAAETYCQNPEDQRSVKSMQRNVQRYLVELGKVERAR